VIEAATPDGEGEPLSMTGPQKVAALLLAVGKPPATRLLQHFAPTDLRAVTRAAAELGPVSSDAVQSLIKDFEAAFMTGAGLLGDIGEARKLLSDAVPEDQVATIISDALNDGGGDGWSTLRAQPEAAIAASLAAEHAYVATFLLSKLEGAVSAKVVGSFPREVRNEVLCQMIAPATIVETAAPIVEAALREQFQSAAAETQPADQRPLLAQILNSLDPAAVEDAMKTIEGASAEEAQQLKKLLFTFNDFGRLSPRARSLIFDKLSADLVVLALRGTSAEFRETVLSAMASRSRRLVESELNNGANPPAREIARARKEIAEVVLAMAARNEIELGPAEEANAA